MPLSPHYHRYAGLTENFCQFFSTPRITSSVAQFRNILPVRGVCRPVRPPRITR